MYEYRKDQELPAVPLEWRDANDDLIDFSTGWTFTVKLALLTAPSTVLVTKSSGIAGAATSPNISIDWSTSDFSTLTPAESGTSYVAHVYARRTADSKDRVFHPGTPVVVRLYPAPA